MSNPTPFKWRHFEAEIIRLCCKIFKLIKNEHVITAKTNSSRENGYVFYSFYLCSMIEYDPF